jgi:hypothetical protein
VLIASAALIVYVGADAGVAESHGIDLTSWFRDAQPYLLLGLLPPVGLAAAVRTSPVKVRRLVVTVGVVAPVAFLTDWLNRRGVSALPVDRFAFGSLPLCAVLLGYSLGRIAERGRRAIWIVAAVLTPLAVLLTGTRSSLALLGSAVGVIGASSKVRLPVVKTFVVFCLLVVGLYVLVPVIGPHVTNDQDFYSQRFASISQLLKGNSSDLSEDQSLLGRQLETSVAEQAYESHPLLGNGAGATYAGITALDTPVAPLARFGTIGGAVLAWYVASWVFAARSLRRRFGYSGALTAARSFGAAMLFYLPLSSTFDDKGLSLAATLFAALLVSASMPQAVSAAQEDPLVRRRVAALR